MMQLTQGNRRSLSLLVFVAYLLLLFVGMAHHEPWNDELHSWNIARGSSTLADLFHHIRYEGHPPLWYLLMWAASKITHDVVCIQVLQFVFIAAAVGLLLYGMPLPLFLRALLPFGYFLIYEYGLFSRNYALFVLLAACLCLLLCRGNGRPWLHYLLLLLLGQTHLLGALLGASIHLYYLLQLREQRAVRSTILLHALAGFVVLLPVLYFILPPHDSNLDAGFWASHWQRQQAGLILAAPLKALLPVPAWWEHHFWNTHALLSLKRDHSLSRLFFYALSLCCLIPVYFVLKGCRRGIVFFTANLLLVAAFGMVFPLTSARYCGSVYIAFLVACWLCFHERPLSIPKARIVAGLLLLQLPGSMIAFAKELRFPFSHGKDITMLLPLRASGTPVVTDYSCLEDMVAYTDRPAYCIEAGRYQRFLCWDKEMATFAASPVAYTQGFRRLFTTTGRRSAALISCLSMAQLTTRDSLLPKTYRMSLIAQQTGAIEKSGDLYLYQVSIP